MEGIQGHPGPPVGAFGDIFHDALNCKIEYKDTRVHRTLQFPPDEETLAELIVMLRRQELVDTDYFYSLLKSEEAYFASQTNIAVIELHEKQYIYVVGDLHGSFYELVDIFRKTGLPNKNNIYLFNGDLVDRGNWSCEILLLLLTISYLRPGSIFINRGNHESALCTSQYGFQSEMKYKYGKKLIPLALHFFQQLPVATLLILPYQDKPLPETDIIQGEPYLDHNINTNTNTNINNDDNDNNDNNDDQRFIDQTKSVSSVGSACPSLTDSFTTSNKKSDKKCRRIFIVHAGIPVGTIATISELNKVNRFQEPSGVTALEQLLWSDPQEFPGTSPSPRGFSMLFGPDSTHLFTHKNRLDFIIRSHEITYGHTIHDNHKSRLVTIFSTPDALGPNTNTAEYIRFTGMKPLKKAKNWTYIQIPRSRERPYCPLWSTSTSKCIIM